MRRGADGWPLSDPVDRREADFLIRFLFNRSESGKMHPGSFIFGLTVWKQA